MKHINETTIPYLYGIIIFVLVFAGGWFGGMGGTLKTNLIMASILSVSAVLIMRFIARSGTPKG